MLPSRYDSKKGYGFATPETGGEDIFVHTANIPAGENGKKPYLDEGDTIYYDIGEHNGKPTAVNISFPIGQESKKPPRKPRGRNAKKAADEEAAAEGEAKPEEAANGGGEGGGRSGKGGGKGGGGKGAAATVRRAGAPPQRTDRSATTAGSPARAAPSLALATSLARRPRRRPSRRPATRPRRPRAHPARVRRRHLACSSSRCECATPPIGGSPPAGPPPAGRSRAALAHSGAIPSVA